MQRTEFPPLSPLPDLLPELNEDIFSYLDVKGIAHARCVNTTWDAYALAMLSRRMYRQVNRAISRYDLFVATLAGARSVVGGLAALHVLFPAYAPPPYLEIFTPHGEFSEVMAFLVHCEGFRVATPPTRARSTPPQDQEASTASSPVSLPTDLVAGRTGARGVRKVAYVTKGDYSVFVVQSTVDSALYPLPGEWNSALVNYVGPREYHSAYVDLTAASRALLNPNRNLTHSASNLTVQAWRAQGWDLSLDWEPWSPMPRCSGVTSAGCACARRYFGDRHCAGGVPLPVRPRIDGQVDYEEVVGTIFWWRGGPTCTGDCHEGLQLIHAGCRMALKAVVAGL